MDNQNSGEQVSLRVAETDPKFVGRGIALVDPKVIKDLSLSTGDVVEISGNRRKTQCIIMVKSTI
jgi:transitional endoplasmic reticulum ATPase